MRDCVFDEESSACAVCKKPMASCDLRRNCKGEVGLGDFVESALTVLGITKERVEEFTGKPCGCAARQEALNRFGDRVMAAFKKQ